MKVCIDLTSLVDNFSGIERYAACLAVEMIKDKTIDFILLFKNSVHPMFVSMSNQRNVTIRIIRGSSKLLFNQIKLPYEITKIRADYYLFLAFPVPILLFKKNMVSTIHDICCWDCPETMNGMSSIYFKISHRMAMLKCKRIITISKFSQNRIVDKLHYPKKKIWLVYCGIDKKLLNYTGDETQFSEIKEKYNIPDTYILSLSTLEPRKNLRLLLQAYTKYFQTSEKAEKLVLAGRKGWKLEDFLDDIDKSVLDNICFTGFIEEQDLAGIYGNAKYFVFPSKYEGFGMPPLEALACGTKVLSSNSTSLPEVLGNAVNYFESENMESLYNCLLNGIVDVDENIVNSQIKKFDWSMEACKLINYMRKEE